MNALYKSEEGRRLVESRYRASSIDVSGGRVRDGVLVSTFAIRKRASRSIDREARGGDQIVSATWTV
jgi:hypothetical protein